MQTSCGRFFKESLVIIFPVNVRSMAVVSVSSLVMLYGDCCKMCTEWFTAEEIWPASSSVLIEGMTPDRKCVNKACKSKCCASMTIYSMKHTAYQHTTQNGQDEVAVGAISMFCPKSIMLSLALTLVVVSVLILGAKISEDYSNRKLLNFTTIRYNKHKK